MTFIFRHHEADGIRSEAVFSDCERYRYLLSRRWSDEPKAVLLAMNPSTATEVQNDPTIERFMRRVGLWNSAGADYGAVSVVNVFAWRETDSKQLPKRIAEGRDIVGRHNDTAITEACTDAGIVICGWGQPGNLMGRGPAVMQMLRRQGIRLHALAINADGTPKHPLYIGYAATPVEIEA
ncbi:MAG: hypothetical protein CMK46_07130 [Porticoccus sp.]|jgi:hypothetical protein|uniref:DUF1643 domain-containing protein n=1 Tax=uncultured Brevundimonas sp. TaxID=213418 RepID=UPI000C56B0E3|nr:hypothetical protein [Rhodospirillaceae bacterium]MAY26225.1 hypothetical protein [Polycyclovorans sp.]MBG57981.1 hypothetical protein [Porticoccus sp.]QDP49915.1 MAG: hypothetical protein GOVbin132_59 [Prokaryotic dsDNA virus sp.]MAX61588.1 hypothetical protein [Rhodospirillaceae bacterium]|tara:strand:- start:3677 stop:4216 length:540 start_codon:yes stop_codon:yes gene_type:complete